MESNVNYTIVGAFVISLVAAIVLAIVWLTSDNVRVISFKFDSN